jgi:hypothetical protein
MKKILKNGLLLSAAIAVAFISAIMGYEKISLYSSFVAAALGAYVVIKTAFDTINGK